MGQKAAVASLLEKFPSPADAPEDLRGDLLDRLMEDSGLDVDPARDIEPWLGDRMALAAVPTRGSELGMAPVLALAVTDDQETADRVAGAENLLADDSDYAADREALGGDHVAVAWADLGFGVEGLSGRVVLGLHAEEDALELEGLDIGLSDLGPLSGGSEPTRLVGELPEDALVGFSAGGLGDALVDQWAQLEQSGALAGAEEQIASLGVELPGDLRALLGSDLAVVLLGDLDQPAFGARVATEDPQKAVGIIEAIIAMGGPGVALSTGPADGGYVVASDPALAGALGGDGGLGDTDAFRAAVADPEDASAVGFVDLAAVVDFLVAQGGEAGAEAQKWSAVEALGLSAGSSDEGGRFVLRLTTR